jgi:hypothetical protein
MPMTCYRNRNTSFIIVISAFFSLFAFPANAQYLIRGSVFDSTGKKPLAYASIELQKENTGTVSNNDGYFEIRSGSKEAQLKISILGFETKIIDLTLDKTDKEEIIYLTPKIFILDEVVVTPEKIEELIKAIYKKYKERQNDIYLADAFYRDYSTVGGFPVNASEIFYKVQLNQSGIGEWNFIQGRSAQAKMAVEKPSLYNSLSDIINNSALIRNFPVTEFTPLKLRHDLPNKFIFPINENPGKYYTYKRIGEKSIDNKKVAVISFSPNKFYTGKFRLHGKFEVIEDDFQIVYLEMSLNKYRFFDRLIKGIHTDQFIDSCYLKHTWHYKNLGNVWQLERIDNYSKFHIIRSKREGDIKFNTGDNFDYKQVNSLTSSIYFFNHKLSQTSGLNKQTIKENDRKLIWENRYDPDFWIKSSKVLTEIPFERRVKESFIKSGFYGNLFPGGINFSNIYPRCSEIENRVINKLGYDYYYTLRLFLSYYFKTIPQKEIYLLFNNEIKPIYTTYITKTADHNVTAKRLIKLESAIDRIHYNPFPDIADILRILMELDPSASRKVLIKLRQNEKKYSNK